MNTDQLNEVAGRIEAVGRALMHLVARLEDDGLIDGPAYAEGLRHTFVIDSDASILMQSAQRAILRAAASLDEARHWRRFRRQALAPDRRKRKAG